MKKGLRLLGMLTGFLLLMGMGGLGGTPANKVPTPEKDFSATFIDNQDVTTKCTQVSRDGEVFFLGKKGAGTLAVSFEKVAAASFTDEDSAVIAVIELISGQTVEITVDKSQTLYGNVDFGTFNIGVADLKKVTFDH